LITNTVKGRTARIGNEGLATSFYNDKDEPMADFLVKTLLDCKQVVPDFLKDRIPDDQENLDFNDDSGAEDEDETANGAAGGDDDVWGNGSAAPAAVPVVEEVWGADADTGNSRGNW
jgi:ATP-dependent RNA helicase DDX3X